MLPKLNIFQVMKTLSLNIVSPCFHCGCVLEQNTNDCELQWKAFPACIYWTGTSDRYLCWQVAMETLDNLVPWPHGLPVSSPLASCGSCFSSFSFKCSSSWHPQWGTAVASSMLLLPPSPRRIRQTGTDRCDNIKMGFVSPHTKAPRSACLLCYNSVTLHPRITVLSTCLNCRGGTPTKQQGRTLPTRGWIRPGDAAPISMSPGSGIQSYPWWRPRIDSASVNERNRVRPNPS